MLMIEVCVGSACHLKGSYRVIEGLQKMIQENHLEDRVELKAAFCLGRCNEAVSVRVNGGLVISVCPDKVGSFFEEYIIGRL